MSTQTFPPYPKIFKPGDIVISKIQVTFCDDTEHKIGQEIKITEATVAYYNVWHHCYEKKVC